MSQTWSPPKLPFLPRRPNNSLLKRIFTRKRMLIVGGIFAAFLLITPIVTYVYYARDIGDRERLMNRKNTGVVLKDRRGQVFYRQGTIRGEDDVKLTEISDTLEKAVIASEDKEFYTHGGYSLHGMALALYANIANRDATGYGGSTITQQLVKNDLLSADKSFLRKYQELSMAIAVERQYTKQEILEMYLNSVYFGEGAFGISDASRTYFNKPPADLDLAESSMLVGLLPAPNLYSPISGKAELGRKQQQRVLGEMVESGAITKAEQTAAANRQLAYTGNDGSSQDHAQHYALMVMDELRSKYGEERISRSGFQVTTGLDMDAQKQAEEIIRRRVAQFADQGGRNASLVAIEPKTGQVKALVGSVDWENDEFGKVNMATTPRQPGSSFKPIYYTEAIERRQLTAATILHDEPKDFGGWKPQNFDFRFKGDMTARSALAESRNIPAAEVMQKLGVAEAAQTARRLGISTVTEPDKYGLTLALGTAEAKLYEMTNAYAAFANAGVQHKPVLITEVRDKYDSVVYRHKSEPAKRVMSPEASFVISSILSDANARAPTYGSSLNISGRQVAVKTGTTDESKDAWTIGYTPSLAIGVWVGNNELEPMRGLAGGSSAGIIWRDTMSRITENMPKEAFAAPSGIAQRNVCSGGHSYTDYFIQGTEAGLSCNTIAKTDKQDELRQKAAEEAEKTRKKTEEELQKAAEKLREQAINTTPPPAEEGGRGGGNVDGGDQTEKPPAPKPEPTIDPPRIDAGGGNGNGHKKD